MGVKKAFVFFVAGANWHYDGTRIENQLRKISLITY
jgi:hypothetical protein